MKFNLKLIDKSTLYIGGGQFGLPQDPMLGKEYTHWQYDFDYNDDNGYQDLHVQLPKAMIDDMGQERATLTAAQEALRVVVRNIK